MSFLVRLLGCAVVLMALLVPATAEAKKASAPTPLALAVSLGTTYWGAAPCGGNVKLLSRQRRSRGVDRKADAWVTFGTAIGDNNLAAAASTYTDCAISLSRDRWPTRASMVADWDVLCMTVTHEVGHLLGHAHDDLSGSIMAPLFTDYSAEPPACRKSRPARAA